MSAYVRDLQRFLNSISLVFLFRRFIYNALSRPPHSLRNLRLGRMNYHGPPILLVLCSMTFSVGGLLPD